MCTANMSPCDWPSRGSSPRRDQVDQPRSFIAVRMAPRGTDVFDRDAFRFVTLKRMHNVAFYGWCLCRTPCDGHVQLVAAVTSATRVNTRRFAGGQKPPPVLRRVTIPPAHSLKRISLKHNMASSSNTTITSSSSQQLQEAMRALDAARDEVAASRSRFEREVNTQTLFTRDLQTQIDAYSQSAHHSLQRCDLLLNVIDDEARLWPHAIQMAHLQSQAVDSTFTDALQESARIVHDLVKRPSETSQLVSRIDDLIQSLQRL